MENELYHYGRKGMKWYQNIFTKHKERKAAKQKEAEEKQKASIEEQKKKIRESRSAEEVYKNAHLFTDKELQEIYNRLNTENNIKNLIPAKVNKGKQFLDGVADTGKSLNNAIKEGQTLYDKLNKIFGFSKGKTPTAGGDKSKGKDKPEDKDKGKDKDKDKDKGKDKPETIIGEFIPGSGKSPGSSSGSAPKSKPIIDTYVVDDGPDMTSVAKALTNNIGSRTVNAVRNNYDSIASGAEFASNLLGLPAPKDR